MIYGLTVEFRARGLWHFLYHWLNAMFLSKSNFVIQNLTEDTKSCMGSPVPGRVPKNPTSFNQNPYSVLF